MKRFVLRAEAPWLDDAYLDLDTMSLENLVFVIDGYIEERHRLRTTRAPIRLIFTNVSAVVVDDPERLRGILVDSIRRNPDSTGFHLEGPIPGSIDITTPDETFVVEALLQEGH